MIYELKKMEDAFLSGQELEKLDQALSVEFLNTLSLQDVVELIYFLNHLVWQAFEKNKNYMCFADKIDLCCEYIHNRFNPDEFDCVDLIDFWITLATMTFELTYQYDKVKSIMLWVLNTSSKTVEQHITALEWLMSSQIVSDAERETYKELLSNIKKDDM